MNSFKFVNVDVSKSTSELKVGRTRKIKFLEWAKVLILLYENGVESVSFGMIDKENNKYPAFYDDNGNNPFIKVWVKIDDEKYEITYPVMSNQGGNFKVVERPSQLDIEVAKARAFVKCVAINTGLGLKLWLSETQELAKIEDMSSMDHKQLTKQLEEAMVKVAIAFKDREKAYRLIGTTKDVYNLFCNRGDLIAFEQKMGWLSTLKVAIHDLESHERKTMKAAEKGINVQTDKSTEDEIGDRPPGNPALFQKFKQEYNIAKYGDLDDFLHNVRKTADDMRIFAKQLGIEYIGKVQTRNEILKMW